MKSKVSVIIPTRNRAELLTRALNSALRQTYPNFEIIIIDDASEDHTGAVVQSFKDERLRYILLKKNMGAAAARNAGIEQAEGEYVAFLDSDDQWLPEKLAHQVAAMDNLNSRVGIVYCMTERIYGSRHYLIPSPDIKRRGDLYRNMVLGYYNVPTPAALVRKECFDRCGVFDPHLAALEEWDMWLRISKYFLFEFIEKTLVFSYFTPQSLSTDRLLFAESVRKILTKHYGEYIRRPDALILSSMKIIRFLTGHLLNAAGLRRDANA